MIQSPSIPPLSIPFSYLAPIHSTVLHFIQSPSIPFHFIPFSSVPFHSLSPHSFDSILFHSIPFQYMSLNSILLCSIPFPSVPFIRSYSFHSIPFCYLSRFHEYQVLKVANARKWSHFKIGQDTYFAAASNSRFHDSPVFKWVDNQFIPYQTLSSSKAFDIEPIRIKNDVFLAVAVYYGPYSNIFKWNGERFVLFQSILAAGADMESFTIGDDVFLAVTGNYFIC